MSGRRQESMLNLVLLPFGTVWESWAVAPITLNAPAVLAAADVGMRACMFTMVYEAERANRISAIEREANKGYTTYAELAELAKGCHSIEWFVGLAGALCLTQYIVPNVLMWPYDQLYPNLRNNILLVLPLGTYSLLRQMKLPDDRRINDLLLLEYISWRLSAEGAEAEHDYDYDIDFLSILDEAEVKRLRLAAVKKTYVPQTDIQWAKVFGQVCLEDAALFTKKVRVVTADLIDTSSKATRLPSSGQARVKQKVKNDE